MKLPLVRIRNNIERRSIITPLLFYYSLVHSFAAKNKISAKSSSDIFVLNSFGLPFAIAVHIDSRSALNAFEKKEHFLAYGILKVNKLV